MPGGDSHPRCSRGAADAEIEVRSADTHLMSYDDDEVMLNVLRCQLTYQGQAETDAEARFNIALRPRKPEGSLGRTAQDGHLDSHSS